MEQIKARILLVSIQVFFVFQLKGQISITNDLINGKTQAQIVDEYSNWIKIKNDWANLGFYKQANDTLTSPLKKDNRVVFMGNSITQMWPVHSPDFFDNSCYVNRGIGGQTTPQMLLRFRSDVIDLKPKIVVLLAGTNDIAGNTGPSTIEMIVNNIFSMVELAQNHDIEVILCSTLPVNKYLWAPSLKPASKVIELNKILKTYAIERGISYVDYFNSMVDSKNGLKQSLSMDGVHPNKKGYVVMEPLLKKEINSILKND